ncbi:GNAT family N-acetyltransferase [Methylobacterium sp. Leaf399]|uniref:GNAT family N-acetyltransferase n=1 Tax=Methylobacterium sp. Leaf399 TaxID=1736364 RepID=UPI001FCD7E1C|nr:GNAT family N-acetyltransferase [Methylobacterium sp. Leaf399]
MAMTFDVQAADGPIPAGPGATLAAGDPTAAAPRGAAAPAYRARLHPDLAAAAPLWRRLQAEGACTAYQRLEWAEAVVDKLVPGSGATPLIVQVDEAESGRPVMLLPLARLRKRGTTTIQWLDLGVCDYAAPVMAPGVVLSPAEAVLAWEAVRAVLPKADLVRITRITQSIFGTPNPLALLPEAQVIPMRASGLVIEGDPETLIKRVCSKSMAKDIEKRRKRLAAIGEARFVEARTEAEVTDLFEALLRQRRDRFRELGRFDLLDRPEVVDFYRAAALNGGPDGLVRVFGIAVGGEWIATAYGLCHHGAFHGIILAMAGEPWKGCSPGILIVAEIMVWARRQGLTYLDFTIGDLPYKNGFRPVAHDLMEVAHARSLRGHAILAAERALRGAKATLQRHPALFDRLRESRRMLRRIGRRAPEAPAPDTQATARDA